MDSSHRPFWVKVREGVVLKRMRHVATWATISGLRRNVHLKVGGTVENWDPWNTSKSTKEVKVWIHTGSTRRSRVHLRDGGAERPLAHQLYVTKVGGMSEDHEDPSLEQLSALSKRLAMGLAPCVDFAIWSTYHKNISKFNRTAHSSPGGFRARQTMPSGWGPIA